LEGADEEVVEELVIREVEGVDGVAAAVAADEMDQAVDVAEALLGRGGPVVGGRFVEEVDGPGVDAVVGKAEALGDGVRDLLAAVDEGEGGARFREAVGDDRPEAAPGSGDCDHPSVQVDHQEDRIRVGISLPTLSRRTVVSPTASPAHSAVPGSCHDEVETAGAGRHRRAIGDGVARQ
jgi:hypothetical protein